MILEITGNFALLIHFALDGPPTASFVGESASRVECRVAFGRLSVNGYHSDIVIELFARTASCPAGKLFKKVDRRADLQSCFGLPPEILENAQCQIRFLSGSWSRGFHRCKADTNRSRPGPTARKYRLPREISRETRPFSSTSRTPADDRPHNSSGGCPAPAYVSVPFAMSTNKYAAVTKWCSNFPHSA